MPLKFQKSLQSPPFLSSQQMFCEAGGAEKVERTVMTWGPQLASVEE